MRNRLRLQNLPKYSDRLKLDKDVLVLQRALRNEAQKWDPEEGDWQLLITIKQFHHCKVASYLAVKRFVTLAIKVIPQYCIAHPYCARFFRHSRAQMSACTYTTKEISLKLSSIAKINVRFLLNEHGDLYFLLHNNSVHIVLLNLTEN